MDDVHENSKSENVSIDARTASRELQTRDEIALLSLSAGLSHAFKRESELHTKPQRGRRAPVPPPNFNST